MYMNDGNGIYERFNIQRPADFTGHSLSVSDVVVLNDGSTVKAYYVDSIGFAELPEFFKERNMDLQKENLLNEELQEIEIFDKPGLFSNGRLRDGEATRKMSAFLQGQKPELLHHQKFFENGTAERAKESGTEQNYNMIDGCVNNVPQKPRRIGGRWSVLDRLHIKQAERRQKDNTPQQEQERSRKS